MINFVCVLKKDPPTKRNPSIYDKDWVNKLYRGIKRNYNKPFNFFCLSNIETDVETIPLIHDWKGWWSKIELFRPDLFQGPVLYMDLDIVVLSSFENLVNSLKKEKFYMLEGQSEKNAPNTSMMFWNGDYSFLYENFIKQRELIESKYTSGVTLGDQGYIFDNIPNINFMNRDFEKYFSWKHPTHPKILKDSSFLIFIGKEKPINNFELEIVEKNWI